MDDVAYLDHVSDPRDLIRRDYGRGSVWRFSGTVPVDSGTIWIGDPCYVAGGSEKEGNPLGNWEAFCDRHADQEADRSAYAPPGVVAFREGIAVDDFGGDGRFPVHVLVDKHGAVRAAVIVFDPALPPEDEDDDDGDDAEEDS